MGSKEPITMRAAKMNARAVMKAALIPAGVTLLVGLLVRTYVVRQTTHGDQSPAVTSTGNGSPVAIAAGDSGVAQLNIHTQSVSGIGNVVAQGHSQVTYLFQTHPAPAADKSAMESIWLSEIRNVSPLGIDFRSGLGSTQTSGIFELLKTMYDGRNSKSYAELRTLRDRILKVNPHFGYINWLWGCILKRRFSMEAEAREAFVQAEKQLLLVRDVAPESPYPVFYLALVNLELGNEQASVLYFDTALRMPVHLWSNHMLPLEFNDKEIQTEEAYNKWSIFWFDWCKHARKDKQIVPCDMSATWQKNEHVVNDDWPYTKGEDGVWIQHITINMASFPEDQAEHHYVDTVIHGKGTLTLFDSFESAREHFGVRVITTNEESQRIYDLPPKVVGFGDPSKHFFAFINATKDGLSSTKAFPNELEIVKMSNSNYYYLGYCSTNDLADGMIRLYLDRPCGESTNVLALPWDWTGQSQYKRPQRKVEDKEQ